RRESLSHAGQYWPEYPAQSRRVEYGPEHLPRLSAEGAAATTVPRGVLQLPEHFPFQRDGHESTVAERAGLFAYHQRFRGETDPLRSEVTILEWGDTQTTAPSRSRL